MRYTVNDVPQDVNAAAFFPRIVKTPKSTTYGPVNRNLVGHPGNRFVPSPKPAAIPGGPLNRQAQPSYNAPDMFAPSVYYLHITGKSVAGVRFHSTNELPVPAVAYTAIPQIAYRPRHIAGARQVGWPSAVPVWQSLNNAPVGS